MIFLFLLKMERIQAKASVAPCLYMTLSAISMSGTIFSMIKVIRSRVMTWQSIPKHLAAMWRTAVKWLCRQSSSNGNLSFNCQHKEKFILCKINEKCAAINERRYKSSILIKTVHTPVTVGLESLLYIVFPAPAESWPVPGLSPLSAYFLSNRQHIPKYHTNLEWSDTNTCTC